MVILNMLYHFELQMAGVILLTAMVAGGISLWLKRRKMRKELENANETDNDVDLQNNLVLLSKFPSNT